MKYIFIVSFPIRIKKLYQSVVVAEELQVLQKGAECLIRIGLFLQNAISFYTLLLLAAAVWLIGERRFESISLS